MSDVLTQALEQIRALQRRVDTLERQEYIARAGVADTLDGQHAAAFAGITTWRVSTTTTETLTAQAYTALVNSDQDIAVLTGDIILAWWSAAWREDTARAISAIFVLAIGASTTQLFPQASAGANYVQNVALVMQATAASDATITIEARCYVYTAGDSVEVLDQEMHIMRIRPGG